MLPADVEVFSWLDLVLWTVALVLVIFGGFLLKTMFFPRHRDDEPEHEGATEDWSITGEFEALDSPRTVWSAAELETRIRAIDAGGVKNHRRGRYQARHAADPDWLDSDLPASMFRATAADLGVIPDAAGEETRGLVAGRRDTERHYDTKDDS